MKYYIIIRGPLGSGKSSISEKLSKILKAEHISVDKILDEHKLTKDKEEGYISQMSFLKANEIAVKKAEKFLEKDIPVIFDGNFYWKSQIENLVESLDYPKVIFTLKVPLKICIDRDSKRNPPHGEDAAKVVYKKTSEFDYGVIIDASKSLDETIEQIVSHLKQRKL